MKCKGIPESILQACYIGYVPVVDGGTATVVETRSATERRLEVGALTYVPRTDILVKRLGNPEHSEDTCHVVRVPITNRLVKGICPGKRMHHGRYCRRIPVVDGRAAPIVENIGLIKHK